MSLLIASFTVLLWMTACAPSAEGYIDEVKTFIETVATEGADYTEEDWKEVGKEFKELLEKANEVEGLTDEQKKELAKLEAKFSGVMTKKNLDKVMEDASEEIEKVGKAIEGFLEGLAGEDEE